MTPAEVVARHEGLVKTMAGGYATDAWPYDDLAQKARIALWQAAVKSPGDDLQGAASYIIKRRILAVLTRKPAFAEHGQGEKGARIPDERMVWVDDDPDLRNIMEAKLGVEVSAETTAVRHLDATDIRAAIEALPTSDQRAVGWGKAHGRTTREVGAEIGRSSTMVSKLWNTKVLPSLTQALQGAEDVRTGA